MAIAIKKSSAPVKEDIESSLTPEIQTQISNNLKLDATDYTALPEEKQVESTPSSEPLKQSVTSVSVNEQKSKRTEDLVQLKFSKGKRAEAKAFYSTYDVKMNAGFEMAYEFLKEEVQAGRVRLSKSGIQRIS